MLEEKRELCASSRSLLAICISSCCTGVSCCMSGFELVPYLPCPVCVSPAIYVPGRYWAPVNGLMRFAPAPVAAISAASCCCFDLSAWTWLWSCCTLLSVLSCTNGCGGPPFVHVFPGCFPL